MKKISNNIFKLSSSVAALALAIGLSTVNSACVFWFNQPKMPESMTSSVRISEQDGNYEKCSCGFRVNETHG